MFEEDVLKCSQHFPKKCQTMHRLVSCVPTRTVGQPLVLARRFRQFRRLQSLDISPLMVTAAVPLLLGVSGSAAVSLLSVAERLAFENGETVGTSAIERSTNIVGTQATYSVCRLTRF